MPNLSVNRRHLSQSYAELFLSYPASPGQVAHPLSLAPAEKCKHGPGHVPGGTG